MINLKKRQSNTALCTEGNAHSFRQNDALMLEHNRRLTHLNIQQPNQPDYQPSFNIEIHHDIHPEVPPGHQKQSQHRT